MTPKDSKTLKAMLPLCYGYNCDSQIHHASCRPSAAYSSCSPCFSRPCLLAGSEDARSLFYNYKCSIDVYRCK